MISTNSAKVTLPGDQEILITREFDAPRELVYRAYTEPDLVERWWAGRRGAMKLVEIDLRVGGDWRYVMEADDGQEIAFHGTFREIVPGERLVTTDVFEGMPEPDEPVVDVVTFDEAAGRTTLSMLMRVGSRAERDMILQTGMESGIQEQMDILDGLLAGLAA